MGPLKVLGARAASGEPTIRCFSSSYTDKGRIRSHNEDAVLDLDEQGLWAVADGMGGHTAGALASGLAVEALREFERSRFPGRSLARLRTLLAGCNARLREEARKQQVEIIGCTVAVLSIQGRRAMVSWSGDSRIYRCRERQLLRLTRDHSQLSLTEDRDRLRYPQAARLHSDMLMHALGGDRHLHLEHGWFAWQPGDRYLLCTDGLYKELGDDDILAILLDPDRTAVLPALSALYHERGARDNIGMVYVEALP